MAWLTNSYHSLFIIIVCIIYLMKNTEISNVKRNQTIGIFYHGPKCIKQENKMPKNYFKIFISDIVLFSSRSLTERRSGVLGFLGLSRT